MNRSQQNRLFHQLAESNTSLPLIIGVGASTGGLEACGAFLRALGKADDLAIVFVQHPEKENDHLPLDLLERSTSLSVVKVSGRKKIKGGTIYVCPPGALLELKGKSLQMAKPDDGQQPTAPIDYFLQSLAENHGERGVGVILSGLGSDGTLGLKAISDAGGLTFAQSAESAQFDSMPRSAATTGVADHVLSPEEIAAELKTYVAFLGSTETENQKALSDQQVFDAIPAIAKRLLAVTNHNFQHYKQGTLVRRIRRRMHVLKLTSIDAYVQFLSEDNEEPQALFRELLISVTAFFRDTSAFEALAREVIPQLFANRQEQDAVRIWVPGCATGEEAYSIAILCCEQMENLESKPEVQIFATDIDERALKIGRLGTYPIGIKEDVSEERLRQFFVKRGNKYQLKNKVREMVLFSTHNLISDPPFSRLDLISCRNLLIYLGPHLQKKLIPLFHYALRPSGFLMLGPSENIATHGELFQMLDPKHRISQRKGTGVGGTSPLSLIDGAINVGEVNRAPEVATAPAEDLIHVMQRIVLDEFAPKSVIVQEDGKILCASADMQKYLTIGTGSFQNNVIKLARDGLRIGLRATLQEAKLKRRRIDHDGLSVRVDGLLQPVMITVQPMPRVGQEEELFIVVFHDVGLPFDQSQQLGVAETADLTRQVVPGGKEAKAMIAYLEKELSSTREDLEKSIQEFETTNEELKSSNEELLSLNEELQSANEELETSKEEIQSTHAALAKAHNDLESLFQSTQIATLFLDADEQLLRFTPSAAEIYNLIATDIGRPLGHITHTAIAMPPLPPMAQLAELAQVKGCMEQEIQTHNDRWFLRRVLPYVLEGDTKGLIVNFIDITERKRSAIRLATLHQVTRILVRDPPMAEIFPGVLRAISETMNATYTAIWLVDSSGDLLHCMDSYFDPTRADLKRFSAASQKLVFGRGEGLPGRVWQSRETSWIEQFCSDENFVRQTLAAEAGLVSGVALPIIIGTSVHGVIEIFSHMQRLKDESLQEVLQSLGHEIGQFIARKNLDERLRDQEARKSAILEASLDAIVTMDKEGRIVDFNPAAKQIFGYTEEEMRGRSLAEAIIPPEYREAHNAGLVRYIATGKTTVLGRRMELTAMRKDGSIFPVELAINGTETRDGTSFFTAHLRDISERQHFIQTIVDRDRRITALLDSTAEGIYGIDLEGYCTFANVSCARLLGFDSPDDLVGQHLHQLIHHTFPDGKPYPEEDCKIYGAFRLGESVHVDNEFFWRADGTSFDAEYWSHPLDQDGQVTGCVVSFLDVTERKQMIRDLANRESHLRRVIDNTLGFIGVLDNKGVLLEANETALQAGGVTRADVIGKPFWECYWWSHDENLVRDLKAAVATALNGLVVHYDVEVRMAGDSRLMIDFMLVPVKDADGNVTHLIPSGVDISERVKAETEVQQRVAQLNLALESGQLGIWEWDVSKDHVTWSDRLYEMFGYAKETFVPTKAGFLAVVHPEDRSSLERMFESDFSQTRESHEVEFRVIRGDNGEIVWTLCRGSIHCTEAGSPISILSVTADITVRKERELSLAFLAELQIRLAALTTSEAIIAETSQCVAQHMKLSHFFAIKIDKRAERADIFSDHSPDGAPSLVGVYSMSDFATKEERRQLAEGSPMVVNDTAAETRPKQMRENFARLEIGSMLNSPSSRDHRLKFMLSAIKRQPHVWREDEIDLLRQLSDVVRLKLERAEAESALRKSEERFRDLADNISQLTWMADASGKIFWYNQRWFDYTGTTFEEMKGWGWKSVQHPDHLDRVMSSWQHSLETGEGWEHTFPLRSKDHEYRWFLSRAQPIRSPDGTILRWFGSNTDITDAKKAAEELQASQQRLRLGIEVADFALAEIDYTTDEVTLSPEAARLYGMGDSEMKVNRARIHETFLAEERDNLDQIIQSFLESGNSDELALEHRISLPNHEVRWLSIRERVVFDRTTNPPRPKTGILAARDVTVHKHWELELADRESHLRRVINNQLGLVGVIDRDGILVEVDDRFMSIAGFTRDDVIGKHFAECAWWTYDDAVAANMREAMSRALTGETVRFDVELYAKGDQRLMIDFMIAPIFGDDGKVEYLIPSGVDISERKVAEEQLEQARAVAENANRSKSEFLANMSHEIRTPMTAILGFTDLVAEKLRDNETLDYVRTIRQNGEFLLDIINDILDLSKIESGKFEISHQMFSPHRLVEDVRSIMEVRASSSQIGLVVEYQGSIPEQIESDPKRLKQVLINLVGNAIKFTPTGSVRIVVSFSLDTKMLRFDVIDSGIGISPIQMSRLFKPFSQGDGNVNREFGGTGLGLAISKRLTEMLGGEISVDSEFGRGSTFSVSIAVGNVIRFSAANLPNDVSSELAIGNASEIRLDCHVLVVDDRRDIRFLSNRFLTEAGATVDEAEDGMVAVSLVTKALQMGKTFDLILLDMQMPKLDGYATAKALRQLGFAEPIVALTADAMQGDMKRCIESGCNDYLSKPIDKTLLLNLVKRLTR